MVIDLVFDNCGRFAEGLAPVQIGDSWGFVDTAGSVVIPARFGMVAEFGEGLAPALEVGTGWGYVDSSGQWVISPRWDDAGTFRDGLARVLLGDRVGYIDRDGAYVWQPQR